MIAPSVAATCDHPDAAQAGRPPQLSPARFSGGLRIASKRQVWRAPFESRGVVWFRGLVVRL
jgi:hypothetical protein